ncbi:MAG: response regulator [Pseudomonadales bacterium]|nr:response regulator [Pseudomonadales bacterium]
MPAPYILCVDDDKTILISLRAQLKHCFGGDFNYEVAESAMEAWEIIEELEAEGAELAVIISDWLMPEVKGDQFLIDVHAKRPDIIKIILTGHADNQAIERARKHANLAACIAKPWKKEEVTSIIVNAMEAK